MKHTGQVLTMLSLLMIGFVVGRLSKEVHSGITDGVGIKWSIGRVHNIPKKGDYQIDIHMDTIWVWDSKRLVAQYTTRWDGQLDSIIMKDNE